MISRIRLLTVFAFRLNSRDYVSDRPTNNRDTAYNLSSIRIEQTSETYISKSVKPGVSVTVHSPTASDYERNKADLDEEAAFKFQKQV